MSSEEKLRLVASACRTAAILLDASPNKQSALAYVDPLPLSSIQALERLRLVRRSKSVSPVTGADAFSRALELATAFERAEVPYTIGGALALGIWGVPRGTVHVDVNVFVEPAEADRVADILESVGRSSGPRASAN